MASSNSIGDQLNDAIQNAISSNDFSTLPSTIERYTGIAAENIAKGLAQAQSGLQRAQQEYTKERLRIQQRQTMRTLYASANSIKAGGVILAIIGSLLGISLIGAGAILLAMQAPLLSMPLLIPGIAGAALAGFGIKRFKLARAFEQYRDAIALRTFCTIDELAARTSSRPSSVVRNLKAMVRKGLFKQAALDDDETMIIMTHEAYQQYRQAQAEAQRRHAQQAASRSTRSMNANQQELTPEIKSLLSRGESYIAQIRASNDAIPGPEISQKIDQIEQTVRTIFQRAAEQPEVADDLDRLMDYYLPTTVKLLDAYRDFDSQPVQSQNVVKSKREIEAALDTLNVAFQNLLDSIFRDMAWDVSSDITVLHAVLAQEGLVDGPLSAHSQPEQPGSQSGAQPELHLYPQQPGQPQRQGQS